MITETMISCFLTLQRTLNFTKAAEELYMTQQSVSQNISKLETDLGLKLFVRDTHSVRLTECGALYAEDLGRLVRQHRALISELRLNHSGVNRFKVGISDHPDFNFLDRILQEHAASLLPGRTVEICPLPPSALLSGLSKQKLDMVFTLKRYIPEREGLLSYEVLRLNMALFVSRKHPAYTPDATFKTFAHDPLVIKGEIHDDKYYGSNEYILQEIARAGIEPSGFILVSDIPSALSVASAGGGMLLGTMANEMAEEYNLAPVPIPGYEAVFTCVWGDYVSGALHQELYERVKELCARRFPAGDPALSGTDQNRRTLL